MTGKCRLAKRREGARAPVVALPSSENNAKGQEHLKCQEKAVHAPEPRSHGTLAGAAALKSFRAKDSGFNAARAWSHPDVQRMARGLQALSESLPHL